MLNNVLKNIAYIFLLLFIYNRIIFYKTPMSEEHKSFHSISVQNYLYKYFIQKLKNMNKMA